MGENRSGTRPEIRVWRKLSDATEEWDESAHRFYGRRKGHILRPKRRNLVETLLPRIRVTMPAQGSEIDLAALFGTQKRAYWIEIGFGGGEHLAAMAAANPDIGIIGCEPFINGVANLLCAVDEQGLDNVRIFDDDVRTLFPALPDASFERLFLLYADPWPKKRHNRRRLVQPETLSQFARLLKDGGEFRYASDFMEYVRWTLRFVSANADFKWLAEGPGDWRERPADAVETRYEAKARRAGSPCVYLRYQRSARA